MFFSLLFDDKFIKYFVVQKVVQMSLLWLMANQNHMFSAAFCWHLTLFVEIKLNSLNKKGAGGQGWRAAQGLYKKRAFCYNHYKGVHRNTPPLDRYVPIISNLLAKY